VTVGYSAIIKKRHGKFNPLSEEEIERAFSTLYALHGYMVRREKRRGPLKRIHRAPSRTVRRS
jgi:hypothetical protein